MILLFRYSHHWNNVIYLLFPIFTFYKTPGIWVSDGLALELETGSTQVTLDFNYAYNASCAYSPRWACPLAPPENVLPIPIRAGEKNYRTP